MSAISQHSEPLNAAQILARLNTVAGPGSGLIGDIVTAPIPRISGSFGGYPIPSSAIASIPADPAATFARFNFGV